MMPQFVPVQPECGPVCLPIKTLEDLSVWQKEDHQHYVSTVPFTGQPRPDRPRTLICHDMAGGYLQDRFVQGSDDCNSYRFFHWQSIDTFVYFSHYFITIPPPGWTNAAHRHGVPMLGTLITEWDDGASRCRSFLSSEKAYMDLVKRMVEIATFCNFDGWLVNIENEIKKDEVGHLIEFVRQLTKAMHDVNPHSQVIWYDSVITSGKLNWQDELNENNSAFFDVCDGIFLNYTWTEEKLRNSFARAVAKQRPHDVYVGVDVFGRNCFGGGGFNTKEAVTVARRQGLSVAIFAQGWVYEKLGKEEFTENENKFWSFLHEHCAVHPVVRDLPFATSFCQGFGNSFFQWGEKMSTTPWHNLSLQRPQPTFTNDQFTQERKQQHMSLCTDAAYIGGSCLKLTGMLPADGSDIIFRLFAAEVSIESSLVITYTVKAIPGMSTNVFLRLTVLKDGKTKHVNFGNKKEESVNISLGEGDQSAGNASEVSDMVNKESLQGEELPNWHRMAQSQNQCGWETRVFRLEESELFSGGVITEISLGMCAKQSSALPTEAGIFLGQIQILQQKDCDEIESPTLLHTKNISLQPFHSNRSQNLSEPKKLKSIPDDSQLLTVKLDWDNQKLNIEYSFVWLVYTEYPTLRKNYFLLGQTPGHTFMIDQLPISNEICDKFYFIVQHMRKGEIFQPLASAKEPEKHEVTSLT
ncbi:cytosolic endo-beta-N-acetylglucosaminidase [Lingula anatina]|uniref:Cytosolic endo-beta-N-acetylglucosaminidase n=1 Tax=Lingula anatina TaxID=7574 RepID=A0A1S3IZD1_LINAN|nr:cytosolic endo-beta-N-acetylglucosaminidase [Lingula anatina]|eukprot:XP_013403373.1 cytosolic endo-beta-N-acetylglucosaminidase [Lingula anatina]